MQKYQAEIGSEKQTCNCELSKRCSVVIQHSFRKYSGKGLLWLFLSCENIKVETCKAFFPNIAISDFTLTGENICIEYGKLRVFFRRIMYKNGYLKKRISIFEVILP